MISSNDPYLHTHLARVDTIHINLKCFYLSMICQMTELLSKGVILKVCNSNFVEIKSKVLQA